MNIDRRAWLLGAAACAVAGCETPPSPRTYPELSFSHLPPIRLDVARIDVVAAYVAPGMAPHVDHLFPRIPRDVVARWGRERLLAVGHLGEAFFTINDASAVSIPLPRTTGLTGLLTQDQSDRCDLRIAVTLEVYRPLPAASGEVRAEVKRSRTMAEDLTLNEREAAWFQMTEQAMRELDSTLAAAIRDKLAPFVIG